MKTLSDLQKAIDELEIHNLRVKLYKDGWKAECEVKHFSEWFISTGSSFEESVNMLIAHVHYQKRRLRERPEWCGK
jgi:hypothetical protein